MNEPGKLPFAIAALLDQAAERYGLAPALLRAVAWVESRGRPDAVSRAGAMGVLQLMPRTAKGLNVADPFNPADNIDGGARYLAKLLLRFEGDTAKALAGYNWGPSRVARGATWPTSVQRYVRKVSDRAQLEEQILAAETTEPRVAPIEEGGEALPFPVSAPVPHPGEPPWPLACFPAPHCSTCTCEAEGGNHDA